MAIGIALGAIGAGLAFVPWTYRVEATGQAMPVQRNDIFAPDDGDVTEVLVRGGAAVKADDPLVVLRNNSLHAEVVATRAAVSEKTKLAASLNLQAEDASARGSTDEAVKLRGEELRTRTEVDGLQEQLKVLEEREERLTILAPANGTVATFQPEELLKGRPVRRGERLLEVMNEQGPWRLELEVPEHRMGHVLGALGRAADHSLSVEYVPATAVELTLPATLREENVGTRTEISEKEGSVVVVQAAINPDLLPGRRIGAEVIAKIDCGERSLFYVLFGDVVEFVQRHVWW
jgi:multidrug efflux pump subunit AcrA (membrane-fusion protein)